MPAPASISADRVKRQISSILSAWGMDKASVDTTATIMTEADLRGIDSHGLSMMPMYAQMKRVGQIDTRSKPVIVAETATTARIDGKDGLGYVAGDTAMKLAVEKALRNDIAAVTVFNSHHFGACGCYAEIASNAGLIGIVSTTTRGINVVPTFGARPMLGTNPLSFAVPAGIEEDFLLDMSTSTVAANKVRVYALNDKPIEAGWVLDGDEAPVTDPHKATRMLIDSKGTEDGGLTPLGGTAAMAGYKGYGLSIIAQILSGTLSGGSFSPIRNETQAPSDGDNIGHFFLALNPAAFRPRDEFLNDMDALLSRLRATKPSRPSRPVLIPGDPERITRAHRLEAGIPVPAALADQIRAIAEEARAEFVLDAA